MKGYTLAVFGAGVAVGKLVEKIERLDRKTEETKISIYAKMTARMFSNHCDRLDYYFDVRSYNITYKFL